MSGFLSPITRIIEPSGRVVLPRDDETPPAGFTRFGTQWAIRLPPALLEAGYAVSDSGVVSIERDRAEAGRPGFIDFWRQAMVAFTPDPLPFVPVSQAGLGDPLIWRRTPGPEGGRREQVEDLWNQRANWRPPAPGSAVADMILRQVAVLRVPARVKVRLAEDGLGGWVLGFEEAAGFPHIFGRLQWTDPSDGDRTEVVPEATPRPRGALGLEEYLAIARVAQLAGIASACLPADAGTLRIEVRHALVDGMTAVLVLRPRDRGLPLLRMCHRIHGHLGRGHAMVPPKGGQGLWPAVEPATLRVQEENGHAYRDPEPPRWHTDGDQRPHGWTYNGDSRQSRAFPRGLPFAITTHSGMSVPTPGSFSSLSAQERAAFLEWLSGERRGEGLTPRFADLYLQGLEYRLLADTASKEEAQDLVAEIVAVSALFPPDHETKIRAETLLDWLGAIGRRPILSLGNQRPMTVLVACGRAVVRHGVLSGEELSALSILPEVAGRSGDPDQLVQSFGHTFRHGLRAHDLRAPLVLNYRSLSGLCDVTSQRFFEEGRAIPDLSCSIRLVDLLRMESGGDDGGEGEMQ